MSIITKKEIVIYYSISTILAFILNSIWSSEDILINNALFTTFFISCVFVFTFIKDNTEVVDFGWGLLGILLILRNIIRINVSNTGQLFLIIAIFSVILIYCIRHTILYFRAVTVLDKKHLNFRYKEMEDGFGRNRIGYWLFNYTSLHVIPNNILALCYYPIHQLIEGDSKNFNTGLFIVSYLLSYFAIVLETLSDEQLYIFRKNRSAGNLVIKTGLWRRIRHPNYLGEILFFLSLFLMNYSFTKTVGWNLVGLSLFTSIFLFYSIPAMEKHLLSKYGKEYEDYQKTSRKLIPFIY
jgi:steroid 5-alpha reductase family enzyme